MKIAVYVQLTCLLLVVALAGCGGGESKPPVQEKGPLSVKVEAVAISTVESSISAKGEIKDEFPLLVSSPVVGVVEKAMVTPDADVLKDDLLGVVEEDVSKTLFELRSPVDGVVTRVDYNTGDKVEEGNVIYAVVDRRTIVFSMEVYNEHRKNLRFAQMVKVKVDGIPGARFDALIFQIEKEEVSHGNTLTVLARLKNPLGNIKVGMKGQGLFNASIKENVAVLPAAAIVVGDDKKSYLFVAEDGKAVRYEVETGRKFSDMIQVTNGVSKGELVIVEGAEKLKDGMEIKVVE